MILMTYKAADIAEARAIAAQLRATVCRGTDWTVRIDRPLFHGDAFRVAVV